MYTEDVFTSVQAPLPTSVPRYGRAHVVLLACICLHLVLISSLVLKGVQSQHHYVTLVLTAFIVAGAGAWAAGKSPNIRADDVSDFEGQMQDLANFATDMFWETDKDGLILSAGGRLMSVLHPDQSVLLGRHYLDVVHLDEIEMAKMLSALNKQRPYSDIQSTFHDPDGKPYYISLSATPRFDHMGRITRYLGVGTNVTERVRHQAKLRHVAEHDMLTGLANRYAFSNWIARDLKARKRGEFLSVMAIDLDGFKSVNDTYGHQAGDALLKLVAKRLRLKTRESDWAARLGGDEFVVVSRHLSNPMDACLVAARLTDQLSKPYRIGGMKLTVKASVGIACAPKHGNTVDAIMKCADIALYQAKADGRGCYRLFNDDKD